MTVLGDKFKSSWRQEDAHEFLIHLLDKLDEAEKKILSDKKAKTVIQKIFEGECRQSITCEREPCGHISHTSQAFMDLSLDILPPDRNIKISLEDFTRQEQLSQDNQYKCEKCNVKSRARKQTSIHRAPPILTIHLKRFSPSGHRKNTNFVAFPEILDLNPFMSDESRRMPPYRLIATVCHHGMDYSGMAAGHYTANCRSSSGTWNNFDDTSVLSFIAGLQRSHIRP
jgi:ubiquitin carboxyl-terminal hydrolase 36/42